MAPVEKYVRGAVTLSQLDFVQMIVVTVADYDAEDHAYLIFVTDATDGVCVNFFWPV